MTFLFCTVCNKYTNPVLKFFFIKTIVVYTTKQEKFLKQHISLRRCYFLLSNIFLKSALLKAFLLDSDDASVVSILVALDGEILGFFEVITLAGINDN